MTNEAKAENVTSIDKNLKRQELLKNFAEILSAVSVPTGFLFEGRNPVEMRPFANPQFAQQLAELLCQTIDKLNTEKKVI